MQRYIHLLQGFRFNGQMWTHITGRFCLILHTFVVKNIFPFSLTQLFVVVRFFFSERVNKSTEKMLCKGAVTLCNFLSNLSCNAVAKQVAGPCYTVQSLSATLNIFDR